MLPSLVHLRSAHMAEVCCQSSVNTENRSSCSVCGVVQGCHVVLRSSGLGGGEKPGSNSRCHLIRCGYVNSYSFSNSTETFDLHYTSVFCLHCSTPDLLTWPRFVVSHRVILNFYFLCILFFIKLIVVAFSRLAVFQGYEFEAKKYLLPAIDDLRVNE